MLLKRVTSFLIGICLVMSLTGCVEEKKVPENTAFAVYMAEFPRQQLYPTDDIVYDSRTGDYDWSLYEAMSNAYTEARAEREAYAQKVNVPNDFYRESVRKILSGAADENRVYSPVNVYMALAMLAELTGSTTRQEILNTLHANSLTELRESANTLWNAVYNDNGANTVKLGSSVWMREGTEYNEETFKLLADSYYADSFIGKPGTTEYDILLRSWLNKRTDNQLEEKVADITLDPETILALCTTIHYNGSWMNKFYEGNSDIMTFKALTGDEEHAFMHSYNCQDYITGDNYTATRIDFSLGGAMYVFLPNEGISIDELLADDATLEMIIDPANAATFERCVEKQVNLSIPKFDIDSDMDLIPELKAMGISKAFDSSKSDFTPMSTGSDIKVTDAKHAARVSIDEDGCTAAAYMVMLMKGEIAWLEKPIVDMVLDRPFIFTVTAPYDFAVFTGIVNHP